MDVSTKKDPMVSAECALRLRAISKEFEAVMAFQVIKCPSHQLVLKRFWDVSHETLVLKLNLNNKEEMANSNYTKNKS